MLAAGIPEHVPVQIVNRFCSSGLMAVTDISNKIKVGQIDIGLAVGIESMSQKWAFALTSESTFSTNRAIYSSSDDPWTPNSVAVNNHPQFTQHAARFPTPTLTGSSTSATAIQRSPTAPFAVCGI